MKNGNKTKDKAKQQNKQIQNEHQTTTPKNEKLIRKTKQTKQNKTK